MTLGEILLTAHILTAILTVGWLAMQAMIVPGMIRRGPSSAGYLRGSANAAKKIGPASGLVFLLGIALVLRQKDDHAEFSHTWVSLSMLGFIVAAVIGAVLIGRAEESAAAKLEAGQNADDEASKIAMFGGISTLILVAITWLMVAKPGVG